MNENMKLSAKGRALIKAWEGCRLNAYRDSVGVPTIGYGHTAGVKMGTTITQAQADKLLDDDLRVHVIGLYKLNRQLTQNQFDALASFHFNIGPYVLDNDSVLRTAINANNTSEVVRIMKKYNKAGGQFLQGLANRRAGETALYATGIQTANTVLSAPAKFTALLVDGVKGLATDKALQMWLNVTVDGLVGRGTVTALQKKIGVVVDGVWGIATTRALQVFLNKNGANLIVDGSLGALTIKALQTYLNKVLK
ncbi:lysozyme [Periweissella cryptocerci]|uniref:Lysozyme n=1 Tax=Periweissella cryptocerci TaxID=2506420 RepID=A0A4P6YRS8_9LACO|nr:lysozyme [Periweissella cryptocerci]QBO35367.1 lysozyme [Periweissella cryptocerci]